MKPRRTIKQVAPYIFVVGPVRKPTKPRRARPTMVAMDETGMGAVPDPREVMAQYLRAIGGESVAQAFRENRPVEEADRVRVVGNLLSRLRRQP